MTLKLNCFFTFQLINQSSYLIYFYYEFSQNIHLFSFSSFTLQKKTKNNTASLKKTTPQKKVVIAEVKLDGIDTNDTGNLKGLLRLTFINEECENLKVFNDRSELTRSINQKMKSDVLEACRCSPFDKWQEYFFNDYLEYLASVR